MKWKKFLSEGRKKKQQSIKPSNDKYEIAMWSEYYFPSLRMLGRLLGWRGEAYLYVNGRLIIFICWQRGSEQLVCETCTHTHSHKEEWETSTESLVIRQLFFCLFCVRALMTEERNNRGKTEGERDQSSGCQLQQGSPLQNILITSPPHYRCHVNERGRKKRERERKRTSSREDQFCNFLITFLATFACAAVNATNWMFLWFLSK